MNTVNTLRHRWTISDEKLALTLYLTNKVSTNEINNAIKGTSIKLESMRMKLMNIQYLDTGFGLKNATNLTKTIFSQYKSDNRK